MEKKKEKRFIGYTYQDYPGHIVNNEFHDKEWHETKRDKVPGKPNPPTVKEVAKETGILAVQEIGVAADQILLCKGIGVKADTSVTMYETKPAEAHVTELCNKKILAVSAGARALHASASASATPVGVHASAKANVAEAYATAAIVEDIIEANARAVAVEAAAYAGVGLADLGAKAEVAVTVAKVEAGISNTPLQASAEGPGANAEAGVSFNYAGASAGAHVGEARAGPFAVRAGVRIGAGIRYGVPEVDVGPLTVPCSIM